MIKLYVLKIEDEYLFSFPRNSTFIYSSPNSDLARIFRYKSVAKANRTILLNNFLKRKLVPPKIDLVELTTKETII